MKKHILMLAVIVGFGVTGQATQIDTIHKKAEALLKRSGLKMDLEFFETKVEKLNKEINRETNECCKRPTDPVKNFQGVWYGEGTMDNPNGQQTRLIEFRAWLGDDTYIISIEILPGGKQNVIYMLTNNYKLNPHNTSFITYETSGTLGPAPGSGSCVSVKACQVSTVFRNQNMVLNEVEVLMANGKLHIYGEGRELDSQKPVLNYAAHMERLF